MLQKPVVLLVVMVVSLVLTSMLAFWIGQRESDTSSDVTRKPMNRLRAQPGTERANARALTSSIPSTEKNRSSSAVEVWGSLEPAEGDDELSQVEKKTQKALTASSPEAGLSQLLDDVAFDETNETDSLVYAGIAMLYTQIDSPDFDESSAYFEKAWANAKTTDQQVEVAYFESRVLLQQGKIGEVFEVLTRFENASLPASGYSLELGIIIGMAYEELNHDRDAIAAYEHTMVQAKSVGLERSAQVSDVYRTAAYRLSQLYTNSGELEEAQRVARSAKAALRP